MAKIHPKDEWGDRKKEAKKTGYPDCRCTWHSYMVGDGCELCNPERAKELAEDDGCPE